MRRPVTLEDFYHDGTGLSERKATGEPRPQPVSQPRAPRAPVLTPEQRQAIVDGLVAARAARRLAAFAGVQVTPGRLAGVAVAALAVFGGYKWYKSRGAAKRRRRRIKNSLLGG